MRRSLSGMEGTSADPATQQRATPAVWRCLGFPQLSGAMLELVISGGQTGADQGGLRATRACGIPTGGWAPRGWLTEAGPAA
jgi:hypothetical protein